MLERIQKIISAAGVTSRRAAEQLIVEGRVRVNGAVVTELGTKADASKDHIKVDGKLINPKQPPVYILLNKPAGHVTTLHDPEGRPTVRDILKGVKARVYPVGRLDYDTEGLLLLTNDGDFAHLITHPKHEFPKTYRAKVKGVLEDRQINELENGIYLDDGRTAPAKIKKVSKEEANSWLEITIHEGRKRQVRRMFDRVGHSVIKLKRIKTGSLTLGDLPEGAFRYLTGAEVKALKEEAQKTEVVVPKSTPALAAGRDRKTSHSPQERGKQKLEVRRERTSERRTREPGRAVRDEHRRQDQGARIPGRGASGRGPRHPSRSSDKPAPRTDFFSQGTEAAGRPAMKREGFKKGTESAGRPAMKRAGFKPAGPKKNGAPSRGPGPRFAKTGRPAGGRPPRTRR